MDDDMQEGGDPAEAFDRLRAIVEGQDRELALLRRAVEGLAAERAHIDVPDYSETLGRMQQGVDAMRTDRLRSIAGCVLACIALAACARQGPVAGADATASAATSVSYAVRPDVLERAV